MGYGHGLNPGFMKILLDRGASVMARNIWEGPFLHLAFQSICCLEKSSENDSLLLLVKAKADVNATDFNRSSVSDLAIYLDDWDKRPIQYMHLLERSAR